MWENDIDILKRKTSNFVNFKKQIHNIFPYPLE